MKLENTFKAINENFPGKDNAGLRRKLRENAQAQIETRKQLSGRFDPDLTRFESTVALSAVGKAKLRAVNSVYQSEIK